MEHLIQLQRNLPLLLRRKELIMKIIVKERFSIREKGNLKFLEVKDNPIEIEDSLGKKAIALGYAEETEDTNKQLNK